MKLTKEQKIKLEKHLTEIGNYLINTVQPKIKDGIRYTWLDGRTDNKYELIIRPKMEDTEDVHNCVKIYCGHITYNFKPLTECTTDWDREHTILNFEITNGNMGLSVINEWASMKVQLLALISEQNTIINSLDNFTL